MGQPQAEQRSEKWTCIDIHFAHFLYGCEVWTCMKVQMGRLEITHSHSPPHRLRKANRPPQA
eukprot:293533-Chlamydomonas_euryale.AAC.10